MTPTIHNDKARQGSDVSVTVRVPQELLDDVDKYAVQFEVKNPGVRCSRADAIRLLLTKGLKGS